MRILQLIDSLHPGGAERMAVNIANAFDDHDIPSILVATRALGSMVKFANKDVSIKCTFKKSALDLVAFYRLINIVNKFKPDVIHCHSSSVYWGVILKILLRKPKLVFHDHFGNSEQLKAKDRAYLRLVSSKIDAVIAVNDLLKKWTQENTSLPAHRVTQIDNFPYIKPKSVTKNKIPKRIIHLANFRPQKDHHNLLNAIRILADQQDLVSFEVVLVGTQGLFKEYDQSIDQAIYKLRLENHVKILGPVENVESELMKSHIGVLSSSSEGLPVSLLEYGLCGLAVVSTSVGQCPQVLGDGEYGWLAPPQSPEKLAEALVKVIINKDAIAESKASKLKKYIKTNYSAEFFIKKYKEFILV